MVAIHAPRPPAYCQYLLADASLALTCSNKPVSCAYRRSTQLPENSSDPFSRLLGIMTLNNNSIAVTLGRMHNRNQRNPHNDDPFNNMSLGSRPPEFERLTRDFCIRTPTPTSVSLILPPGCSRFDFLERAQDVVQKALGADLIDSDLLDKWRHSASFSESYEYAVQISVEIQRDGDLKKMRLEHEGYLAAYGQELATEEDTAVAFAAFFANQGMDLFNGEGVQTEHRGLQLNDEGLVEIEFYKSVALAVAGQPGQSTHQIGLN